ncbi:MAG: 5-methylcytosine-specific restriction endonuclease system specificity protein McrC [Anaerorhabdus sp.]|uniref:5-methylcytosine-specific restriction endonuclease system specificity protein McrC n=1 Tax=Anaerorhabdus sp. TaxID=1872524 RepID=UPI002FCB511C
MIPVKNIYYMLSYSFQILNEQGYKNVQTEEFHNVAELCASILAKGISFQLKKGLGREYIEEQNVLATLGGKIDISASIKAHTILKKQMICVYDEFSVNTQLNKILKTTVTLLVKADISKSRKKELKKLLVYFNDVDMIDVHTIDWNVKYNKNNHTYKMLISVCNLVIKGLLQTNSNGNTMLMDFLDEQRMCRLYEKFILEYYRKEHPEIKASASQIPWQLDDDMNEMLPIMQTDITLSNHNKVLIIDAKYYLKTLQTQYNTKSVHSGNLYQIFTYVKNKELELGNQEHEVAGMLLYAKTDEFILPNNEYKMSGNRVIVKTLDLDCDFAAIASQLDGIVDSYFELS